MPSPLSSMEMQEDQDDTTEQRSSPASALAGPGTTRQNRKLQLRKNGFRGRAIPNRNVTPKRNSSGAWSSPVQEESTPEPVQAESSTCRQDLPTRGRSSSILQEVSNSSLRRKAKNKAKHDSVVSVFQDENSQGKHNAWSFESSPACLPLEAPNLTKSRKKHQRTTSNRSNPDNEFLEQHVAYLESELAAYQQQLASLTSPSVAKEKSQKLRALNQEIKRLEEENTRWEAEFDQRVSGLAEERAEIESALRARIYFLEADTDNYVQKVKELQAQLDVTRKSLEMAESANVEFERRLETFAHLLVLSPKKPETPLAQPPFSNGKRHSRQKLSLHRFPTNGSLQQPMPSPGEVETKAESTEHAVLDSLDIASDAEYETSARVMLSSRGSRHSLNLSDLLSDHRNPPPSRRMRRFHGGSHMPKPLILGAAQLSPILSSAPVCEPSKTPREFPFPEIHVQTGRPACHEISPLTGRRRAMTSADGIELSVLEPLSNLLPSEPSEPSSSSEPESKIPTPPSDDADITPRDYSSIGPNVGRNLFEELRNARVVSGSDSHITPTSTWNSRLGFTSNLEPHHHPGLSNSTGSHHRLRHQRSISEHTALPTYPSLPSLHDLQPPSSPPSQKQRAGILAALSELWKAPFSLARRCLHRAHSAMQLSRTLHKLQWWLVHALLGPMATRRLMACSLHDTPMLLSPANIQTTNTNTRRRHHHHHRRHHRYRRSQTFTSESSDSEQESPSPCPAPRRADTDEMEFSRHSPWLWVKFSLTLAFAIGAAIKEGPGVLLRPGEREGCGCLACVGRNREKVE